MKYKSEKDQRFDSIYRSYVLDVYQTCLFLAKCPHMAEEATQQVFLNYYERLHSMDSRWEPECVKAYLIRCARNQVNTYHRSSKYETTSWDEEEDFGKWNSQESAESAEDMYLCRQEESMNRGFCNRILEDLKVSHENWYQVYYMMYYSDKTHDEITEQLDITKEVLYSRLYRAKRWIQKNYEEEYKRMKNFSDK